MKIYFLTSEIVPFAETGSLAYYSKFVPIRLQAFGHDIRLTAPKYGFISERKYILREVIRLREIKTEYDGKMVIASAKSAFIPQTRVQVYFMEHPQWFQPLNTLLYKSRNGRPLSDNDERFGFFGKTAVGMLTHLFWKPDVIICNSWQSAFVPIIYKQLFSDQKFYENIRTVQIIHCLDDYAFASVNTYHKLGLSLNGEQKKFASPLQDGGETVNSLAVSANFADLVIALSGPEDKQFSQRISKDADFKSFSKEISGQKSLKGKLELVKVDKNTPECWYSVAEKINELLNIRFA